MNVDRLQYEASLAVTPNIELTPAPGQLLEAETLQRRTVLEKKGTDWHCAEIDTFIIIAELR